MNRNCPACGGVYNLTPQHAGRHFKCQRCSADLVVHADGLQLANAMPAPAHAPPPAAPPVTAPAAAPAPVEAADTFEDDFDAKPSVRRRRVERGVLMDYLMFRRMIAPLVIQVLFWVGIAGCVISGVISLIVGFVGLAQQGGDRGVRTFLGALLMAFLSWFFFPFVVRLYCEVLIVVFRISETLSEISAELKKPPRAAGGE